MTDAAESQASSHASNLEISCESASRKGQTSNPPSGDELSSGSHLGIGNELICPTIPFPDTNIQLPMASSNHPAIQSKSIDDENVNFQLDSKSHDPRLSIPSEDPTDCQPATSPKSKTVIREFSFHKLYCKLNLPIILACTGLAVVGSLIAFGRCRRGPIDY